MERADQEAIDMFMSITGASATVAIQKLEAHVGNLNEAINAHFSEGDRNTTHEAPVVVPEDDLMEIDDPIQVESSRPPFPALPSSRNVNPFALLDPGITRSIFDTGTGLSGAVPFLSHPREARQIPIEVKDGNEQSSHSGFAPIIQDGTGITQEHGPEIRGTVMIDEEDADILSAPTTQVSSWNEGNNNVLGGYSHIMHSRPTARGVDDVPDNGNDVEEQMIRAAIEASKRDAEIIYPDQSAPIPPPRQSHLEDPELAHAVSLSLKAAEQEKFGPSELEDFKSAEVEDLRKLAAANGRLEVGGSSAQEESEDIEEQPLVRHRSRPLSSGSVDVGGGIVDTPPSSPRHDTSNDLPQNIENDFRLDEWGGISSLEHDEAVMLEAALFGGIPEGSGYQVPYAPHHFMQNGLDGTVDPYAQRMPRPPSPSLTAQRLIREQQDDEYLASLQADREKEMKAREEDEIRHKEEQAAREAALEEERLNEEELRRKLEEEQEMERQLAAKEASLPHEPASDDENAVTLLVRMPDGSRRGRRFLKSHKLQYLFDFIDVGRVVKPGTYRLVRPYPRRAFSDGECATTFNELGLTSRQEALFLELI